MNDGTNPKQQKGSAVQSDHRTESVREGFEPFAENPQASQNHVVRDSPSSAHTQIRAQIIDALGRDLSQVVAAWPKIPSPLKAAILAIVNSSTASMQGES
jgi:hypothetical protein